MKTYTGRFADAFALLPEDETVADRQWLLAVFERFGIVFAAMGSGLLALWGLAWTIGWIVRGFMGIPRGQDDKSMGTS